MSRDPIEERGGVNLYGFVGNDGVDRWDFLGMTLDEDRPRELELDTAVDDDGAPCDTAYICWCIGSLKITIDESNEPDLRRWFNKNWAMPRRLWGEDTFERTIQEFYDELRDGKIERELGRGESVTLRSAKTKALNNLKDKLWYGTYRKGRRKPTDKLEIIFSHSGYEVWKSRFPFLTIGLDIPKEDECKCKIMDPSGPNLPPNLDESDHGDELL